MNQRIILTTSCLWLAASAACLGPDDVAFDLGTDAGVLPDGAPGPDASMPDAEGLDAEAPDASALDGGGLDASQPDAGGADVGSVDGGTFEVTVLNSAADPFADGTGASAFLGSSSFLASTATTVTVYALGDGRPDPNYLPFVLTSTQFGGNAAGAVATHSAAGTDRAFFLPTGSPQVGALDLEPPGAVLTEAALAAPLSGGFSADLRVHEGHLYVSDAPFGASASVRAFDLASFTGAAGSLVEVTGRRFVLPNEDLDGDSNAEILVGGRLGFSPDGTVGLVAFTVLGNSAPALAGGVLAFDLATGVELGRVLVPTADSSTVALGYVGGFAATASRLYVVTAEKQFVPSFAELGGHLSVYEIVSYRPFEVRDADVAAPYHQPLERLASSGDNPVGVAVLDGVALVVNAPYFLDGSLDVFALGPSAALQTSLPLGALFVTGFAVPGDPVRVPGTRTLLLGTEAGTLRFSVELR